MSQLCFNCMNRSSFLLGEEDPDLAGQIDAAAEAGFTLIGPDAYSIRHWLEHHGAIEALARRIDSAGLRTFELPTLMVGPDPARLREDTDELLRYVDALGPDFVQVNVVSETDDALLDEYRRAGVRFREAGAGLAVEYLPWLPEIKDLSTTRPFMAKADVEGAGVILDSWHFFFSDDDWKDLEAIPLEEIAYVQFDDHPTLESDDLVAETVGRRVMPGEGSFELGRFCDTIRAKGFDGVVSCEILSEETRRMDRRDFARQVYQSSRRFWS